MPPYPPKNAPTGCARRPATAIGVGRYQRLRRTSTAGEPVGRAVARRTNDSTDVVRSRLADPTIHSRVAAASPVTQAKPDGHEGYAGYPFWLAG